MAVLRILKSRTRDKDLKGQCISLMEKIGSFAYTKKVLGKLYAQIQEEIKLLGGNPLLEALLEKISPEDGQVMCLT